MRRLPGGAERGPGLGCRPSGQRSGRHAARPWPSARCRGRGTTSPASGRPHPAAEPGVGLLVPAAVEVLVLADREIALGAGEGVVPVIREVPAPAVDGPGLERNGIVVADGPRTR